MELNSSCKTATAAVRTFHGAPRPTCDDVRVNISTSAPGRRDDVIQICDSDTWQGTYSLTGSVPLFQHSGEGVFSPTECVNQSPVGSSCRRLKTARRPPPCLRLQLLCIISAELSWSGKSCFQQQDSPRPLPFHPRPSHHSPLTPTFDSFVSVCLWVCACVSTCLQGTHRQCETEL